MQCPEEQGGMDFRLGSLCEGRRADAVVLEGSVDQRERELNILVIYYTRFGVLGSLARLIAEGVQREDAIKTNLLEVDDTPLELLQGDENPGDMALRRATVVNQLASADALIVGAPAYFGSMASPVKRLFEDCVAAGNPPVFDRSRPWHGHLLRDKVGAAFTASATPHGGNEQALHSILTMMMHLGMVIVTPGQHEPILENDAAPYGATAVVGANGDRTPTAVEQEEARLLGQRVARVTLWLQRGRTLWEKQQYTHDAGESPRADATNPTRRQLPKS